MITLTENAAKRFKDILTQKQTPDHVIRLAVKGGGCSGFSYAVDFVEEADPTDKIFEQLGVTIAVDLKSYLFLKGTELDYVEDVLESGFRFNNPNATASCGCGKSVGF